MKHKCYKSPTDNWEHFRELPCECPCNPCKELKRTYELPAITQEEIDWVYDCLGGAVPGPWKYTQLQGFGPNNFIVSNEKYSIVAELKNPGNMYAGEFMAWCRDGVPRLLKEIQRLRKELEKKQG